MLRTTENIHLQHNPSFKLTPVLPRPRSIVYMFTSNLLLILILSPNFPSNNGMGTKISAIKPKTELPHPNPSLPYRGGPARGSTVPAIFRNTIIAAIADTACCVYASTIYVTQGKVVSINPQDMIAVPTMGTTY